MGGNKAISGFSVCLQSLLIQRFGKRSFFGRGNQLFQEAFLTHNDNSDLSRRIQQNIHTWFSVLCG